MSTGPCLTAADEGHGSLAIAAERPHWAGQRHQKQEDGGVDAERDVTVVGEAAEATPDMDSQAALELAQTARPPHGDTGQQDECGGDGRHPHDESPRRHAAVRIGRWHEEPAVKPRDATEEVGNAGILAQQGNRLVLPEQQRPGEAGDGEEEAEGNGLPAVDQQADATA